MTLTDQALSDIYCRATGTGIDPVNLNRAKAFINMLFVFMTPDAYIDTDGTAERDAFMLIGNNPTPLFAPPTFEEK